MDPVRRWVTRFAAVVTAAALAVFIPAVAWASQNGVYDVADELVRGRRRSGVGGIFGLLCCLVVVVIVVAVVLLITRSRRRGRGGPPPGGPGPQ
jgi:succinate dehydrogenase hydrophobic anchor subunit